MTFTPAQLAEMAETLNRKEHRLRTDWRAERDSEGAMVLASAGKPFQRYLWLLPAEAWGACEAYWDAEKPC